MSNEFLANVLSRNLETLKATLADFSDADMLVRPTPAANHAAWQVGHLAASETRMINAAAPGTMPELPAGFAEKFTPDTAKVDDPAAFPKKAELLDALAKVRGASVAWARSLSDQTMRQPTPERMQRFAATAGELAAMIPVHVAMHIGQIQVIRRKLGKPILF